MPSKIVEIRNNWHKPYVEEFKGDTITIPAGGSVRMNRYDGVAFMGTCKGYMKWEGDPKEYPYAKSLDMIDVPESGEMNTKEEWISPKTGERFKTKAELDAHLGAFTPPASAEDLAKALIQGFAQLGVQNQPTTAQRVYACPRCDFETTHKPAYLKHAGSHERSDAPSGG